ncbi:hypothetical protein ACO03_11470 [Pantoea ananatis]|nr:hypothetical protein ACO03_11470 [Pantoea ananatis]
MNYSEMSDFEINRSVAVIQGFDCSVRQHFGEAGLSTVRTTEGSVDYCRSWKDAGPIIEKQMICLAADVFAEPQDGGKWVARPAYGWDKEAVRSDNPLRAAMILFLQSREKPNE